MLGCFSPYVCLFDYVRAVGFSFICWYKGDLSVKSLRWQIVLLVMIGVSFGSFLVFPSSGFLLENGKFRWDILKIGLFRTTWNCQAAQSCWEFDDAM